MKTYEIVKNKGHKGIKCLVCKRTSYNTTDLIHCYCGSCNRFHLKDEYVKEMESGRISYEFQCDCCGYIVIKKDVKLPLTPTECPKCAVGIFNMWKISK